MARAKVLLADDHPIFADGLQKLIEKEFQHVGTVHDGVALLEATRRLRPDVVVTDISMPGVSGLEAVGQIRQEGLPTRVVFMTMHAEPAIAKQAFRIGASGYLVKHAAGAELIQAIHAVLGGGVYLTPLIAGDVLSALLDGSKDGKDGAPRTETVQSVTPRQRELLRLIARGLRMKEVAGTLNISTRTAEAHKYLLMRTLGLETTAELIQFAIKSGLLDE